VSWRRNALELPNYLRIDLRANHVVNWKRSRLTLFAEVINLLNRQNLRQSAFGINRTTGLTSGLLDDGADRVGGDSDRVLTAANFSSFARASSLGEKGDEARRGADRNPTDRRTEACPRASASATAPAGDR
jgi:hypothetical protein